jgi:hypothetical protein
MTSSHHRALRSPSVIVRSMWPKPLISGNSMATCCRAENASRWSLQRPRTSARRAQICRDVRLTDTRLRAEYALIMRRTEPPIWGAVERHPGAGEAATERFGSRLGQLGWGTMRM